MSSAHSRCPAVSRCALAVFSVAIASTALPRRAFSSDEARAEASRPNILFCIADDASYPHMGAYGTNWVETPGFDRVAREGLLFTNCYTPNAKCAPSRAAILTGRNSWQLEAACNHWCHFPAKFGTYAEALAENGYHVGKVAKGWAPGVAVDEKGRRRELAGAGYEKRRAKPPASAINASDYAANFEDFLDANSDGRPFCFWYGCTEPHRAYEYGAGIAKAGKKLTDVDRVPGFWPDNETVRTDLLDYAFEIEHFDRHLARMLDELDERKLLANTIVVVTADNGMPFPRVKGQEYEMSNHLPLAIMWPGGVAEPGRTVSDYVSFIDFAPTFLEVAGVERERTAMQPITGKSLVPVFRNDPGTHRDHVLIGKERHDIGRPHDWGYPIRGIVEDGFLYVRNYETNRWPAGNPETGYLNCDGSPTKTVVLEQRRNGERKYWDLNFGRRPEHELFDVRNDPECLHNLAGQAEHADRLGKLRNRMEAELKAEGDPRMFGKGHLFEQYEYADRKSQNFYERFTSGEKLRAGWVNPGDFESTPIDEPDGEPEPPR